MSLRTLTAKDVKIALARYVQQEFGENITGYKFYKDLSKWLFQEEWRWPNPAYRMFEVTVESGQGIPPGLTAEEVYGVMPNDQEPAG